MLLSEDDRLTREFQAERQALEEYTSVVDDSTWARPDRQLRGNTFKQGRWIGPALGIVGPYL